MGGSIVFIFLFSAIAYQIVMALIRSDSNFNKGKLSHPSTHIYNRYNALPKDSRPMANIKPILLALDSKYGRAEVNRKLNEFQVRYRNYKCFGPPRQRHMMEYYRLLEEIERVEDSLKKQRLALNISNDRVDDLLDKLREESKIINRVTRELS